MKKIIAIASMLALLAVRADAQTFGGGQTITGITNVAAQVSTGVYLTNTFYPYNPQRSLILGGISTNETVIGWYAFQIPPGYQLVAGTTNIYITGMFTNSLATWTNSTTYTTNIPAMSPVVNLPGYMGLNIGNFTNTAIVIP